MGNYLARVGFVCSILIAVVFANSVLAAEDVTECLIALLRAQADKAGSYRQIGNQLNLLGPDRISHLFGQMTASHYKLYERFLSTSVKPAVATAPHLDVGAADGSTALMIRKQRQIPVTMIDLYADSLTPEVKQRLKEDPLFKHVVYKPNTPMPFPDKTFGSLSLFYVLHHTGSRENASALIADAVRVLRDDGRIIVLEEEYTNDALRQYLINMDELLSRIFYPA